MHVNLFGDLRAATPADWRQLADITAEAFADDPVNTWIFGNSRAIESAFAVLAREIYAPRGQCYLAGEGGAAMWCTSDVDRSLSTRPLLSLAAGVMRWGSKGAVKRAITAGKVMDANHPREPHMYLFTIGTRKTTRGQGIGKALIRPVLEACDREGLPAYLENSNPDNTGFYMSHGVEHLKLFEVGEGSPPLEAMWRNPKAP